MYELMIVCSLGFAEAAEPPLVAASHLCWLPARPPLIWDTKEACESFKKDRGLKDTPRYLFLCNKDS